MGGQGRETGLDVGVRAELGRLMRGATSPSATAPAVAAPAASTCASTPPAPPPRLRSLVGDLRSAPAVEAAAELLLALAPAAAAASATASTSTTTPTVPPTTTPAESLAYSLPACPSVPLVALPLPDAPSPALPTPPPLVGTRPGLVALERAPAGTGACMASGDAAHSCGAAELPAQLLPAST